MNFLARAWDRFLYGEHICIDAIVAYDVKSYQISDPNTGVRSDASIYYMVCDGHDACCGKKKLMVLSRNSSFWGDYGDLSDRPRFRHIKMMWEVSGLPSSENVEFITERRKAWLADYLASELDKDTTYGGEDAKTAYA